MKTKKSGGQSFLQPCTGSQTLGLYPRALLIAHVPTSCEHVAMELQSYAWGGCFLLEILAGDVLAAMAPCEYTPRL